MNNMIIGVLKDLKSDKPRIPALSGDAKKFVASEDEIVFKLDVENKSEEIDYKFIPTDAKESKNFYIFKKSDIISKIKVKNSQLYIISGDIRKIVAK